MDNAQEIRTVILNALRDDGKFDAKKEAEQLWNSLQKFVMELPLLQKQSMGEVNALLANVRKEFPKDTNELAEFAVYMNFLTPGELVAVSREGGSSGKDARACEDGKCKSPDSPGSLTPVPEEAPKKKETRKSLEAKVRASRADIDDYNSKRVSILKDYESQKYKNPADRRKAYKEACAKIQALRGSMGNPVGTYWENRNQWEAKTKQSWSRKLAAESGRDVLDAPRKREQARIIRIVDEKTGNLLAAYDEWTANYTGSIRQADALALIRSKQEDIATMRKRSGGRYLDLRIDASGVKRFGDEERSAKVQQNAQDQKSLKILANRDSIGSKLDGLQGYKGRMAKKYLADAEADIAQAMRKKSAGRIDARAMARADHAVDRENRISSIQESQPEISVEPYRGSAGEILEVRRMNGNTLMEISLGSENNLKEGQTLDCWRVDGSTAKYLCRATVLQVEGKRALVRMDRGMVKVAPSVGDTIGPRTEDWERKGAPKPDTFKEPKKAPFTERLKPATPAPTTETTSPRSLEKSQAAPVDTPKPTSSPSNGMTFEEGNEFMRPIDSAPVSSAPKKEERSPKKSASVLNPASPKSSPRTGGTINIPSEPPDPKHPDPQKSSAKTGPFSHVDDAGDIVQELERDAEKSKSDRAQIPELQRTQVFGQGSDSLRAGLELAGLNRKKEKIPDSIGVKPGDLEGKPKLESQSPTAAKENTPLTIDEIRKYAPIIVDRMVGYGKKLQSIDEVSSLVTNTIKKLNVEDKYCLAIGTSALQKIQQERPDLFAPPGGVHFRAELYKLSGQYLIPSVDLDFPNALKPDMSIFNEPQLTSTQLPVQTEEKAEKPALKVELPTSSDARIQKLRNDIISNPAKQLETLRVFVDSIRKGPKAPEPQYVRAAIAFVKDLPKNFDGVEGITVGRLLERLQDALQVVDPDVQTRQDLVDLIKTYEKMPLVQMVEAFKVMPDLTDEQKKYVAENLVPGTRLEEGNQSFAELQTIAKALKVDSISSLGAASNALEALDKRLGDHSLEIDKIYKKTKMGEFGPYLARRTLASMFYNKIFDGKRGLEKQKNTPEPGSDAEPLLDPLPPVKNKNK